MSTLRRALDTLYALSGVAAAACLVMILVVVVLQMAARWFGIAFPGSTSYAGYLMAASAFLAFAHALNRGAHIRVSLVLNAVPARVRYALEVWCLGVASAATGYLAYYAVRAVRWSYRLGDVSQGQDATPLWIAQTPMAVGAVLLAVCCFDNLLTLLVRGRDNIEAETVGEGTAAEATPARDPAG